GLLALVDGALDLDRELFVERVGEWDRIARDQGRLGVQEFQRQIARQVDKCVREGPVTTQIAEGVSQGLSTREIEADPAKPQIIVSRSTVSRRIKRMKDRHSAGNSATLNHALLQPRDKWGRPITDAQSQVQ